jgi:hypothetical protein
MKLVFTRAEVAEALGFSEDSFVEILPALREQGFPPPIPGLADRWSIMDVMRWVNRDKDPPAATAPDDGASPACPAVTH